MKYNNTVTMFVLFFVLVIVNGQQNHHDNNIVVMPDYVNLRINENLLINTEYFLSTIYYQSTNNLNFKLAYLPNNFFSNCSNVPLNELKYGVTEFGVNIKNFANNQNQETIDKVYLTIKSKLDYESRNFYGLCLVFNDDRSSMMTVKVSILDLNDNQPVFDKNEYEASVIEGQMAPIELNVNIRASDKDSNTTITYSLVSDEETMTSIPFEIHPLTGRVRCTKVLDREIKSLYKLKIIANDNNLFKPLVGFAKLRVKVLDVNDNRPVVKFLFADSLYEYDFTDLLNQLTIDNQTNALIDAVEEVTKISENTLEGSFICYIVLVDMDSNESSKLDVSLVGNAKDYFKLDKASLDASIFQLPSTDLVPVLSLFTLTLGHEIDREINDKYDIVINIKDNNQTLIERKLKIIVTDSNDNEPKFERIEYNFSVFDNFNNTSNDFCIGSVKAYDPDLGINGTIEYYLVSSTSTCNHSLPFSLNKTSGQICVLDKVSCLKYNLIIEAKDHGVQPLVSRFNANVVIKKRFYSDNKPIFFDNGVNTTFFFNPYSLSTNYIGWVKAYTLDYGVNSNIGYTLETKNNTSFEFTIDSNGYLSSSLKEFSAQTSNDFDEIIKLKVIATNLDLPHLKSEKEVTIRLTNELLNKSENFHIPSQTILYITSNQVEFLEENRNLSILKLNAENNERRHVIKYIINKNSNNAESKCESLFEINNDIGELMIVVKKNFTNLIFDDVCILNISVVEEGEELTTKKNIDLIIIFTNSPNNSSELLASRLLKQNKHAGILRVDFNQILIIFIIFLFSLLLTVLICLIILMRCRSKKTSSNKIKLNGRDDNGLFVNTGKEDTSSVSASKPTSKSTSPISSSSSCIENTTSSSSSTNSKLTEIESLENLKINKDFSSRSTAIKTPSLTASTAIWLGNPTTDSTNSKQQTAVNSINEVRLHFYFPCN